MKLSNAIKKISKLGTVQNVGQEYSINLNGYKIAFSQNGRSDEITCIYTMAEGLECDSMTDYFPMTWHNTLTSAIKFIDICNS